MREGDIVMRRDSKEERKRANERERDPGTEKHQKLTEYIVVGWKCTKKED